VTHQTRIRRERDAIGVMYTAECACTASFTFDNRRAAVVWNAVHVLTAR
jgi:hypothetical protein